MSLKKRSFEKRDWQVLFVPRSRPAKVDEGWLQGFQLKLEISGPAMWR